MWVPVHLVTLLLVPLSVLSVPFREPRHLSFVQAGTDATPNPVDSSLYQLPKNLIPTKYNLTVVPFLIEGNFTFYGKVQIDFTAKQAASFLILNVQNLTIQSVSLTQNSVLIQNKFVLDDVYQRLNITPPSSFESGYSYQVTIIYTGLLQDDMLGFYRSSYRIGSTVKWLAVTQFESTYARRAFPCFDEPAFRAIFTVNVGRFEYQNSISNMQLKSTSGRHVEFEDRVFDTYEDSPHMPTYLVAFCVGELLSVTASDGKFRIWMREDAVDQAQYLIGVGEKVLKTIGDFVSVPYSLPKMDVVAVPDFDAGAMENWGLTTFREKYVLYEKGVSSIRDKQSLLAVVAHEFGHQWFGDLVTPLWWNYTWLNEAFATYFEYNAPNVMEPSWNMLEIFILDNVQYALGVDSGSNPRPITAQVNTPSEISGVFDYVIYEKGGSVLRMTEHFLSQAVFKIGLNYYLTSSQTSGIGTPDNLFKALDQAATESQAMPPGITVAEVLDTWTTQGGYPLLTANRTGNVVSLSQKRYTDAANTSSTSAWYIPLTWTSEYVADFDNTSSNLWLKPGESPSFSLHGGGWYIFNIQQTGFYRVNYDADNWGLLADQLQKNASVMNVNNRAQLVDDAFNLAEDGHIAYYTAFNLSRYLSQEREYVPWVSAMNNLLFLIRRYQGTPMANSLQTYVSSLLLPYYRYVMTNVSESEPHLTSLGRIAAVQWACDLAISECVSYASNAFNEWLNNGVRIGENVKAGVLCTGLRLGGDAEWDAVWNLYLESNNYAEKITILYALGCTQSEYSIEKYLSMLAKEQSDIRRQDKYLVYRAIARRQTGIAPAIYYIVNNYAALINHSGNGTVGSMISTIGAYVIQDEHFQQVQAVANNNTLPYDLRMRFQSIVTSATARRQWVTNFQDSIQVWFNEIYGTSDGAHVISTVTNTLLCALIVVFMYLK